MNISRNTPADEASLTSRSLVAYLKHLLADMTAVIPRSVYVYDLMQQQTFNFITE